jgi:hypothetical protein
MVEDTMEECKTNASVVYFIAAIGQLSLRQVVNQ